MQHKKEIYIVISVYYSTLPLGIYDNFEQAKKHVDEFTKENHHASVCKYFLNEKSVYESVNNIYDNEIVTI